MQFAAAAAAAFFAALAAASPSVGGFPFQNIRAVQSVQVAQVSHFLATCMNGTNGCLYDFDLSVPGSTDSTGTGSGALCQKLWTAETDAVAHDGTLPAVTDGTCFDSTSTWTVAKDNNGNLKLTASVPVSADSFAQASHVISINELAVKQNEAASFQRYAGKREFGLWTD